MASANPQANGDPATFPCKRLRAEAAGGMHGKLTMPSYIVIRYRMILLAGVDLSVTASLLEVTTCVDLPLTASLLEVTAFEKTTTVTPVVFGLSIERQFFHIE